MKNWSIAHTVVVVVPIAITMSGIQAGLIFALRIAHFRDLQWPITLMAVLSAVLLAAGVLRHYWDIYIHRTVRGISFLFVSIDAAGDLFSLISVLFQPKLDILGLVIYGSELILWIGVLGCGAYYNFFPWVKRRFGGDESVEPERAVNSNLEAAPTRNTVVLHDLPSSTSVFRTPSAEIEMIRARVAAIRPL